MKSNIYYYEVAVIGSPISPLTYSSQEKVDIGQIVNIPLRNMQKEGMVIKEVLKPSFNTLELEKTHYFLTKEYLKIIEFISTYYVCSIGEVTKIFIYFKKYKTLEKISINIDITLSSKQQEAYQFLSTTTPSLLFGDTGSGKTEIYMKLFEDMIKNGKSSIFLLPEIGLTPQIKKRLKDKFKEKVAIWHSKITSKNKEKILEDMANGEIYIIVGTRSALFLPMNNLGLIVVDEEHDDSYKSSFKPRINARDLALYFGKVLNIKVVLGSATPSLTSYYKIPNFRLKGTFFKNNKNFIFENSYENITEQIKEKLLLIQDSQAIVFLPTRGNFKYFICANCGFVINCPFCSVAMSLHKNNNYLKCHYCNFTSKIPQTCPKCESKDLTNKRMGTSEVLSLLKDFMPNKTIEKFDRDSITSDKKLNKILNDFNEKKIDILVGTQMISKGHDYHNVKLVVVLGIDSLLGQADFRANEKTLSLLFQIAGRSGRKGYGEVLIQTLNSEFFKSFLNDYEEFLKFELKFRENLYPPYKRLLRFLISHKEEKKAQETLAKAIKCISNFPNVEIVGEGEAPILKISNKYRYHILIRADYTKELLRAAHSCKDDFCDIDIDPINFL